MFLLHREEAPVVFFRAFSAIADPEEGEDDEEAREEVAVPVPGSCVYLGW